MLEQKMDFLFNKTPKEGEIVDPEFDD